MKVNIWPHEKGDKGFACMPFMKQATKELIEDARKFIDDNTRAIGDPRFGKHEHIECAGLVKRLADEVVRLAGGGGD